MRVFITGGSGLIGRCLVDRILGRGDSVVVLTRCAAAARKVFPAGVSLIEADPTIRGHWQNAIANADAVVNLCGEPIFKDRWTKTSKERIRTSRTSSTENIVKAMVDCPDGPKTLVSGSAIGFYGPRGSEELFEDAPPGDDFLAQVGVQWEAATRKASEAGIRVVLLRIGIVLARQGGALERMMLPFRLHVGGPIGGGRQWVSWIHIDDLIGMIIFALDNSAMEGPINATGPEPVTNRRFARTLGGVMGRKSWLPVPGILLRIALGQVATIVVHGQRVLPAKALAAGYRFRHTNLPGALEQILIHNPDIS